MDITKIDKPYLLMDGSFPCKFHVYAVFDNKNELKFIYYGKMNDILAHRPMCTVPDYDRNGLYKIMILESFKEKYQAENAVGWWIKNGNTNGALPDFNLKFRIYNGSKRIINDITGETFNSAIEACRMYGITQSAMSNHLANRPGHRTVKGQRFSYL